VGFQPRRQHALIGLSKPPAKPVVMNEIININYLK